MMVANGPKLFMILLLSSLSAHAQDNPFQMHPAPPIVGRWDLVVHDGQQQYPSWLEVRLSGYRTLVGSYVGQFGSARPISKVEFEGGRLRFTVPPQWERRLSDITFDGKLDGDIFR